jgi:hypothetical protein
MLIWSFDLNVERVRQYGVVKVQAESFGQSAAAAAARRRGKQQPGIRVLLYPGYVKPCDRSAGRDQFPFS